MTRGYAAAVIRSYLRPVSAVPASLDTRPTWSGTMTRTLIRPALVLACLALGGCADSWERPGGTQADLAINKEWCTDAATRAHPVNNVEKLFTPAYTSPIETKCKKNRDKIDCETTGGEFHEARYYYDGMNSRPRRDYIRDCMASLGWRLK